MNTSSKNRFQSFAELALFGCLVVLSVMSWVVMREQRDSAADAVKNAADCKVLASHIRMLRGLDAKADSDANEDGEIDIGQKILRIASQNRIMERQISAIRSLPPVDIPNSDFRRHDTSITLSPISIPETVPFLLACRDQLNMCPIRIDFYNGSASKTGREMWTAQIVLSRVIYAAKKTDGVQT